MGKHLDGVRRDTVRGLLWDVRDEILPHLMEDHVCYVRDVVADMAKRAGWTYDSYFLAAFFDSRELLVEVGEGA